MTEPEHDIDRREPQIALRELSGLILRARDRVRRHEQRAQFRDPVEQHGQPRDHPIRSMITVEDRSGNSASNARICGSTASMIEPFRARSYLGGTSEASAFFTVFFEIPSRRAIARIFSPSARCNRRTSAQSSTLNSP